MGTELTLEIEADDRASALAASEAALRAIEAVEARLSTWRDDSELARLNRAPVDEPFHVTPALEADLVRARELWRMTDGAFDPALGGLVELWGLRRGGRGELGAPTRAELDAARVPDGFGALAITDGVVVRRDARLVLEEGGFGKGVGLDAAIDALADAGVLRALLDFGGQLVVFGDHGADGVALAVADPERRERPALRIVIDAGSIATSGNAERAIVVAGERLSHLLDPRSDRPAPDFGSVTVWARDATTADALSTACFVLGPERALELAQRLQGVEVVVLERMDEGLRVRASRGLRNRIEPLAPNVIVAEAASTREGTLKEDSQE